MPASHDLTPAHCPFRFRRPVSPFSNFGHQVADGVTVTGVQITSRIVTRVGADTRVSVTSRSRNHARGKQKVVENKPRRTSTYWFFFRQELKKRSYLTDENVSWEKWGGPVITAVSDPSFHVHFLYTYLKLIVAGCHSSSKISPHCI